MYTLVLLLVQLDSFFCFLFLTNLRVTVNVNNCMLKAGRSLAMIPLDVVH